MNPHSLNKFVVRDDVSECWPECHSPVKREPEIEERIDGLLAAMTVRQKVGQMIQAEIRAITPDQVAEHGIGSVLNGGGAYPKDDKHASAADWLALADAYHVASLQRGEGNAGIPILWGVDAVHGHNNVYGATLFPHNIGLGAADDDALIERIAGATAAEILATGIDWTFAPTVAVVRNDLWGRTYEGYAETPAIVERYGAAMVRGLQGTATTEAWLDDAHVIATAKHFIGDGGTVAGVDQGDNVDDEEILASVHAPGYFASIRAGVQSVMASFNSWHGEKVHGHRYLLTDVLKHRLGFDGLVVSDWNGFQQVDGIGTHSARQTILAGVDMLMAAEDWHPLLENTVSQVEGGEIPLARIDDAVRRILRVKLRSGLFERPAPSARQGAARPDALGCDAHRALAREAVRKSLVLLKNEDNLLPLSPWSRVLVAGSGAHDIGKQCGGWSLTWQGTDNTNADFPNASSIHEGIVEALDGGNGKAELSVDGQYTERPDVAVVVFGEDPYAEGVGDRTHLSHSGDDPQDLEVMRSLRADGIPVVGVFLTGRPMWVNPELNACNAFVVAWLPGTEGGGVADLLFRTRADFDFTGRLSYSWPATPEQCVLNVGDADYAPLFPYGFGLSLDQRIAEPAQVLDETDPAAEEVASNDLVIFSRKVFRPWQLYVGDPSQWRAAVSGSQFASAMGSVSLKSVDCRVQEDGRQLNWNGEAAGQVYFQAPRSRDLRSIAESGGALRVELRLDEAPHGRVVLRMDSRYPEGGALDITDALRGLPKGEIAVLEFPLESFIDDGVDLRYVDTPFLLWSEDRLSLSVTDIRIVRGEES